MFIGFGVIFCIYEQILKINFHMFVKMSWECEQFSYDTLGGIFVGLLVPFRTLVHRTHVHRTHDYLASLFSFCMHQACCDLCVPALSHAKCKCELWQLFVHRRPHPRHCCLLSTVSNGWSPPSSHAIFRIITLTIVSSCRSQPHAGLAVYCNHSSDVCYATSCK